MYFWERKNEIRDSDEKSARCGILVKEERECGIKTPPFETLADDLVVTVYFGFILGFNYFRYFGTGRT